MCEWYKAATNWPPSPARVSIANITEERVSLYTRVLPLGKGILVGIDNFTIDESDPQVDKSAGSVKLLKHNRLEGLSQMQAEHPQVWPAEATQKRDLDTEH